MENKKFDNEMIAHQSTAPHTRGWFCNVTKVVLTLVRCPPNDSGLTPGEPGHLAREGFCKSQQVHCKYLWQINTKRHQGCQILDTGGKSKESFKIFSVSNRSTRHYATMMLYFVGDHGWWWTLLTTRRYGDMAPGNDAETVSRVT